MDNRQNGKTAKQNDFGQEIFGFSRSKKKVKGEKGKKNEKKPIQYVVFSHGRKRTYTNLYVFVIYVR